MCSLPLDSHQRIGQRKSRMNGKFWRRTYLDLLGTPYHDGLFVFDCLFPPSYPNEPPMVYYYSGGLRLNPNLYECGKVCLSLLGTWTGKSTEMWSKENSTMLQHFEDLVAYHFRNHAHDILVACKAYMEGAVVGTVVVKDGIIEGGKVEKGGSSLFKTKVGQMMNILITNFTKNGSTGCEQFRTIS
ncbi:hypothetical protein Patl1_02251 [Pistacia atlantica]|uniref:Uncharacterized protein n=1 Tax=Pistacia atlantica TaxID=434234 RepID=A0ACC1C5I7_9ROSI|nr:hypothetical protein Patl1_02251 [Pistacia atlantica]